MTELEREGRLSTELVGRLVEPDSGYGTCEEGENEWHWDGLGGVQLAVDSDSDYTSGAEGTDGVAAVVAESAVGQVAVRQQTGESVIVESLATESTIDSADEGLVSQLGDQLELHERVLCVACIAESALVTDTLTDPKQLLQHQLDGHHDGRKCPHCIQAGIYIYGRAQSL